MKALIQRVSGASVLVGGERVSSIGRGMLVLLGVVRGDTGEDASQLARKTAALRIFEDEAGRMNLSVRDIGGEALVVSQFTLAADTSRGNRPAFTRAEEPGRANALYMGFIEALRAEGVRRVEQGRFAARMEVHLVNDGPVTIMLEGRP